MGNRHGADALDPVIGGGAAGLGRCKNERKSGGMSFRHGQGEEGSAIAALGFFGVGIEVLEHHLGEIVVIEPKIDFVIGNGVDFHSCHCGKGFDGKPLELDLDRRRGDTGLVGRSGTTKSSEESDDNK